MHLSISYTGLGRRLAGWHWQDTWQAGLEDVLLVRVLLVLRAWAQAAMN